MQDSRTFFTEVHPAVVFAVSFGVTFFFVAVCCLSFRKRYAPAQTAWCGDQLQQTPFQLVAEPDWKLESAEAPARLHIIWELDEVKVKTFLEVDPAPKAMPGAVGDDDAACASGASPHGNLQPSPRPLPSPRQEGRLVPLYMPNEPVEYFSTTHAVWTLGLLGVRINVSRFSRLRQLVYSVRLRGTTQARHNVQPEMLRRPLRAGESVEAYSPNKNIWLRAKVVKQIRSPMMLSQFEITLVDGSARRSQKLAVDSTQLRRYFPPGSRVLVYREATSKWEPAEVLEATEGDDALSKIPSSFAPGELNPVPRLQPANNEEEVPTESRVRATLKHPAMGVRRPDGRALDCWVRVPVRAAVDGAQPEFVPSYLVRMEVEAAAGPASHALVDWLSSKNPVGFTWQASESGSEAAELTLPATLRMGAHGARVGPRLSQETLRYLAQTTMPAAPIQNVSMV